MDATGAGAGLKTGGFIVEVVEEAVVVRWNVGRSVACEGRVVVGESAAGPSKGDGEGDGLVGMLRRSSTGSSGAGVALGEAGGVSSYLLA